MPHRGLIVDSFAGGGGASLGIHMALGRSPDVAINHNPEAIAMHAENHPETLHFTENVWKVNPHQVTKGRPIDLLWASPDCRHFSRAKGATPVKKEIRSLAWVVCRWAAASKPRVIILENVREFEEWGPLVPRWQCRTCKWTGTHGQTTLARKQKRRRCPRCESPKIFEVFENGKNLMVPDPDRKGLTFKRFIGRLKNLGYAVEWRSLNAADYGAPTHRRRLFLIARHDGAPIVWPEATHGDPKKIDDVPLFGEPMKPWRTAAECIDWSIQCPSIFDRKKPLAEATEKRIAMGIKRYVIDAANPFLVQIGYGERNGQSPRTMDLDRPLGTIVGSGKHAVVAPYVTPLTHTQSDRRGNSMREPMPTVTSAHRGEQALIAPVIASIAHGGGGTFGDCREKSVQQPLGTVHAGGGNHALVAPVLVGAGGAVYSGKPRRLDQPKASVLPNDRAALVTAFIAKHFGGMVGVRADTPLPTTTARGTQNQVVAANLIHMNHGEKQWSALDDPLRTVTSNNHAALVYSFLVKYFGTAIGVEVESPLPTATSKDRFGLVIVHIDGEPYVIVDIGMRMLTPRELARAQGFPDSYKLTGTKTSQVHKIGNSVSPPVAKALVEANLAMVLV